MGILFKGILVTACVLGAAELSVACLCLNRAVSEKRKHSDAVFPGTATSRERVTANGRVVFRTTFAVERSWKGASAEEINVYSGGGCLAFLEAGEKYLVFAYTDPDSGLLETNVCSGTGKAKYAGEDLHKLGKGKAVVKSDPKHNNGMHPTADTTDFMLRDGLS